MATEASGLSSQSGQEVELGNLDDRGRRELEISTEDTVFGLQSLENPENPEASVRARPTPGAPGTYNNLQRWWSANVAIAIPHTHNDDLRNYLALERTYLARIRTANTLATFGVALYQLFRFKGANTRVGLIIGVLSAAGSAMIALDAGQRYFYQQRMMARGKFRAGEGRSWIGWIIVLALIVAGLVLVLVEPSTVITLRENE
ncbi:MAG: hypothetical protein Q9219_004625 [cf. Caloplaca sp. 3 TL-2023]